MLPGACAPTPWRIMPLLMERTSWKLGSVPGEVRLAFGRVGEGPEPILALHGITAQHRAFNAAARHLRHPDGIAALDLRGRGAPRNLPPGATGWTSTRET